MRRRVSRWDRLLCILNCHDWSEMDGVCKDCGYVDPLWNTSLGIWTRKTEAPEDRARPDGPPPA